MDTILIALGLLILVALAFGAGAHLFKRDVEVVREVSADEPDLSPLGTRARVDETLDRERIRRAARQQATEAWHEAGKPG